MDSVTCTTCGIVNEIENIYCWECGNNLTENNTLDSKSWNSYTKTHNTYILKRDNLNTSKSTFVYKNDDSLILKVKPQSRSLFILYIVVITGMLIFATFPVNVFYAMKENDIGNLYLAIVLVLYSYTILFSMNRNTKVKVFSENNEVQGTIRTLSKYHQLKSVLLFKDWIFWSIENAIELSIHFKTINEGILISNKDSFKISVTRNRSDKHHYRGISSIQAHNERDNSIISIKVPNKIKKRKPPKILEIEADNSINDLIVVFLVIVITTKFFIIDR